MPATKQQRPSAAHSPQSDTFEKLDAAEKGQAGTESPLLRKLGEYQLVLRPPASPSHYFAARHSHRLARKVQCNAPQLR